MSELGHVLIQDFGQRQTLSQEGARQELRAYEKEQEKYKRAPRSRIIVGCWSSKLKPGISSYLAHNFTYNYSSNNYALLPKMKATTILSFFGLVAAAGKFPPRLLVEHRTGWNYLLTGVPSFSRRWYVSTLLFAGHRKKDWNLY